MDIQAYLTRGVERIVKDALRATLRNPRESAYLLQFSASAAAASVKRDRLEREGLHVPPFLIASITSQCNLHCAGCYSRCNNATADTTPDAQLSTEEWRRLFAQAAELGISFILLAGGEPLLRQDVIEAAGERSDILFPIFTNGTYLDEGYFALFDRCRNLVPIMSIEGGEQVTDARRGAGVYAQLVRNMEELKRRGLIFGASITVTTENLDEVTDREYLNDLAQRGCKAVVFVEYVPVAEETKHLAPSDEERARLKAAIDGLREESDDMVLISFPGDEKGSGGCLAAGRGFFHINAHGGAEPCPFSPYSDINVRDTSLKEVLASPLFNALRDGGYLKEEHAGGCVLYEKRREVEQLLEKRRTER